MTIKPTNNKLLHLNIKYLDYKNLKILKNLRAKMHFEAQPQNNYVKTIEKASRFVNYSRF